MYFEVEERRLRRPGTEQKMSVGRADSIMFSFILMSRARIPGNPSSAFCNDIFIIILKLESFLLRSRLQIYEHQENKSLKHVFKKAFRVSCWGGDYWPYQYESLKCMDSFYQHHLVIPSKYRRTFRHKPAGQRGISKQLGKWGSWAPLIGSDLSQSQRFDDWNKAPWLAYLIFGSSTDIS